MKEVIERKGKYFSTHNHTYMSNFRLLDAINSPVELFNRAIELGLSGFAVTDHEALSAHVEIMEIREKLMEEGKIDESFTVAFGNEAYLVDELEMGIKYYHWLLLAKDEKGHHILRKLSTQAWENSYADRGMTRVPITKEQVEKIMEENDGYGHVIATSACLGGELGSCALAIKEEMEGFEETNEAFIAEKKGQMHEYVMWNKKVFGDDFYIELAPNDKEDQVFSNRMLKNVASGYNIPMIFATDSHYLKKEDQGIHRAFLNAKEGEREVDAFYSTAYMMELEKVWEFFSPDFTEEEFSEMLKNLDKIQSQIKHYSLFREQEIPVVEVNVPERTFPSFPKELEGKLKGLNELLLSDSIQDRYWSTTCLNELNKRGKWNNDYLLSLEDEASTLVSISERMGQSMASYYNTAQKLVQLMWNEGDSFVGVSRGSAMAFLSNWLLDITQLDPKPYDVPYWRLG